MSEAATTPQGGENVLLKRGAIVRAHLPSKSILKKRLPEIFKRERVGDKDINMVTGYFLNKPGKLSGQFYEGLEDYAIKVPVGLDRFTYVVPPQKVLACYAWIKEFKEKYGVFERELDDFLKTGKIPEDKQKTAVFDPNYQETIREYLRRQGVSAEIKTPEIKARVGIDLEPFAPGRELFSIFAREKYDALVRSLGEKEKRLMEELDREVKHREHDLMDGAIATVKAKVDGVVSAVEEAAKTPTRNRIRALRAAIEGAEELAGSVGLETDFSTLAAVLNEAEKDLDEEDATAIKPAPAAPPKPKPAPAPAAAALKPKPAPPTAKPKPRRDERAVAMAGAIEEALAGFGGGRKR